MVKSLWVGIVLPCLSFTQTLTAPTAPYPADGASEVDFPLLLTWHVDGPTDGAAVYFGTQEDPPHRASVSGTSFLPTDFVPTLFPSATYYWRVVVTNGSQVVSSPIWTFTTTSLGPNGLGFVPVTPCRLVDTRENIDHNNGRPHLSAGTARLFELATPATNCNIPNSALAYSLNVTVVPRGPLGYLTIWPGGVKQPFVSTLNSVDGRVKANAAIVPAGFGGIWVSVFATDDTELIVDTNGYFSQSLAALSFYPLPPCRVADTRNPDGVLGGPILAGGTPREFPILAANCGVPADARAYSLNATAVPRNTLGYLTLWPSGESQPFVSTLNAPHGNVVANAAIVPAGTSGAISAFATDASHLILDINGYFGPPGAAGGSRFFPVKPCRLADTRLSIGEFGGPRAEAGGSRAFRLPLGNCNLPPRAAGFSLNATVVPAASLGYLTLWPTGSAQPLVSTLNAVGDPVVSNGAIVPAGTAGGVSAFVSDATHLILDTNGYFAAPCTLNVTLAVAAFGGDGAGLTRTVQLSAGIGDTCEWTARSNVDWASITPPDGTGPATLTLLAERNRLPSTRSGTMLAGRNVIQISQAGGNCSYVTNPSSSLNVGAAGGSGAISVTTDCDWYAGYADDWISVSPLSKRVSGNGQFSYTIAPNPGPARVGRIDVVNRQITVNQEGAAP